MHNALIQQDTTGQIIGDFFDVYFALGFGFLEHVYSLTLERELMERRNQSDLRASSDGETPDTQLPPVDEPRSRVDPPLRSFIDWFIRTSRLDRAFSGIPRDSASQNSRDPDNTRVSQNPAQLVNAERREISRRCADKIPGKTAFDCLTSYTPGSCERPLSRAIARSAKSRRSCASASSR